MAYTETKEIQNPNWLSRMGSSIKGVLIGVIAFVFAIVGLWWNEKRAVETAQGLSEGADAVVSVGIDKVESANEGKLVHVAGKAETQETLEDKAFGVSAVALRLTRSVEVYQWVEHKEVKREKKGDKTIETTTYTYDKEWCKKPVDSSGFKEAGHGNPPVAMPFSDTDQLAKEVKLGAFRLTERHVKRIGGAKAFPFPQDFKLPETLQGGQYFNGVIFIAASAAANGDILKNVAATVSNAVDKAVSNAVAAGTTNSLQHQIASNPQIGDLRVKFTLVEPHDISICEKQTGDTLAAWTASNKKTFSLQEDGIVDAAAMFASAQSANKLLTWILRLVGFIVMLIGVRMVLAPFATLVDVIPVLRAIVSMGVGLIAFLFSAVSWLLVVALAWLFYRPLLSFTLIVIAVGLVVGLVMLKKKNAPVAS